MLRSLIDDRFIAFSLKNPEHLRQDYTKNPEIQSRRDKSPPAIRDMLQTEMKFEPNGV